ncbi:MAG: T9SS type A sorting domain-containing protein [Crocinitomicaceae bacterium]|nr:T9SS type A sorting domain-containing protein [Crocinitomicaceae bacterium]
MKTKNIWLLALTLLSALGVQAQNLVVTLTNSNTETFAVADIQSIKFGTESMILNELDGTVNTWDINDIQNYAFDGVANIHESTTIATDELNVFPNPSSGLVHINYTSNLSGKITIAVYDINGRLNEELFDGVNQETTTVTWSAKANNMVQAGKYLVKITTPNKAITKPIIIQ